MKAWAIGLAAAGAMLAQDGAKLDLRTTIGPGNSSARQADTKTRTASPGDGKFQEGGFQLGTQMIEGALGTGKAAQGLELVQSAATAKYVPALRYLGNLYELGTSDVAINNKLAAANYKECAALGVLDCEFALGRVLVSDSLNRVEGMAWLELAAEHGSADAREMFEKELLFTPSGQLELARAMKRILLPR